MESNLFCFLLEIVAFIFLKEDTAAVRVIFYHLAASK